MKPADKQRLRGLLYKADRMHILQAAIEEANIGKAEDAVDCMACGLMDLMEVWEKIVKKEKEHVGGVADRAG